MHKKLSIIVTHFKEPFRVVRPLLDSVMLQRSVDLNEVEVVIVNDGDEYLLDEEEFKKYPFDIRYIINEKKTVSAARNRGLDEAQGEYIQFCDCDDMFYCCNALYYIFNEMKVEGAFDGLCDAFFEESHPDTGQTLYLQHNGTDLFVHGKIWKKDYLIKNEIRFRDDLSIHEESPFTYLALNCSGNVKLCPIPFYLWCWNDNSVCRRDPKYLLKTYVDMVRSQTAVVEEFLKRDMTDKAKGFVVGMIWDAYYSLCCKDWKDINNKEYRDEVEKKFKEYFTKFRCLWDSVSEQDKMLISNNVRQQKIMEGKLEMENITFEDFIKRFE